MTVLTRKLWTGYRTTLGAATAGDAAERRVLWDIVRGLVASGHWVVRASSDGTSADNALGNLWVDADDLVPQAPGVAHSWIVLRNAAIGATWDLCLDLNSASGAYYLTAASAVGGYAADGSTTARPTATDEVILSDAADGYWSTITPGHPKTALVLTSTDGQGTRVLIFDHSTRASSALWLFDRLSGAPTWLTTPWIGCVPIYVSGAPSDSRFPSAGAAVKWVGIGALNAAYRPHLVTSLAGRAIRVVATSLAAESFAGTGRRGQSYDQRGGLPLYPVYLCSVGPYHAGYLGGLTDAWWGPERLEQGWLAMGGVRSPIHTFPSDRYDNGLVSMGAWVLASDGGA